MHDNKTRYPREMWVYQRRTKELIGIGGGGEGIGTDLQGRGRGFFIGHDTAGDE